MPPESPKKIYVAILDNDESFNRSLTRLLRASGYEAVSYDSGASYFADGHRPLFDCLLLDIELGDMTGLNLHRKLNAAGLNTPVIYLTGQDNPAYEEQAVHNGAASYFSKTDPGASLLEAIRRATNGARPAA